MVSKRSSDDDDGGLDALLDTMTNVVGILVLVLVVTQMSVADIVQKITADTQVDEEKIQEVSQQLIEKRKEEDELKKVLIDPLNIDAERQREELIKKKELLQRRKKLLKDKQKQKNEFALKIEADRKRAEENKNAIADTEQKRNELKTLISSSLEKKAELDALLDQTPKTAAPADIKVTIPNPRPAPPGAKQALMICFNNELYPVNIDLFRKTAEQRAKAIVARFKLAADPKAGIEPEKFTRHYERLKDQDDFFDVEYFVENKVWPRIRLIPRAGRGASKRELVNPRSRIRTRFLNQLDVRKFYARFHVLPDSYEVYMVARRLFNKAGMLAGWEPQDEKWVLTSWIPGGIRLGPPPPKPATPPKPPATPPKPPNVID